MGNPWFTSDDLLESVKRKISFPASQNTFQDTDILAFANEELAIAMVPAIMSFHEEYFVTFDVVPIIGGTSRYQIPERAIGMKLRGVFWCDNIIGPYNPDSPGNLFDMTRVMLFIACSVFRISSFSGLFHRCPHSQVHCVRVADHRLHALSKTRGQMLALDQSAVAHDPPPAPRVAQLAYVPRPSVILKNIQHRLAHIGNIAIVLLVHIGEQALGQLADIFLVLAQRRHLNVKDVEPVIKILAQTRRPSPRRRGPYSSPPARARPPPFPPYYPGGETPHPPARAANWPASPPAFRRFRRTTTYRPRPVQSTRFAAPALR